MAVARRTLGEEAIYDLFCAACEAEEAGDFARAAVLHEQGANAGYSPCQLNLGNILDDHLDTPDPARAVYWYKRAVKAGQRGAAANLGVHYRARGNLRWSRYWFVRAIEMGDEDSMEELKALDKAMS